jgi:hypothetical protein
VRIVLKDYVGAHGRYRCAVKRRQAEGRRRRPYLSHKRSTCDRCGFVPEHPCQLDVHHIDEDHSNNDPENLGTLCSNCHRFLHFGVDRQTS